jgi:hypothetical protein
MQNDWEEDYLSVPETTESKDVSKNESSTDFDYLEASCGDYDSTRSKASRDGIEQVRTGEVKSRADIAKEKEASIKKQLMEKRIPTTLKPIISIDTEYEQDHENNQINVLSYQLVVSFEGRKCNGTIFPESTHKKHRLSFEDFLARVIQTALQDKVLTKWP